jgi:hypothetical protein
MNKLKNIGITALAGTLVSLSAAQAGGVSVSGSWELSYTNLNHEKVTGNKLGMSKNITFGSSGDVSDGGGVTWASSVVMSDAMGLSSASMNLNMGGIATLAFDHGTGGYGANAVDNIVPTAWEEIDYGLSTGIVDVGAVSKTKGVVNLTIKAPTAGTGISLSYVSRVGGGHIADGATSGEVTGGRGVDAVIDLVDYSGAHFAYRLGFAGEMELKDNDCSGADAERHHTCNASFEGNPYAGTAFTKLALGPIHFGVQGTFKDPMTTSATGYQNLRSIVGGAAFVVGDTLSFSYGKAYEKRKYMDAMRGFAATDAPKDNFGAGIKESGPNEWERIEYHGFSVAVNMGPVALKGTKNYVGASGENGTGGPKNHSEINLSIAF